MLFSAGFSFLGEKEPFLMHAKSSTERNGGKKNSKRAINADLLEDDAPGACLRCFPHHLYVLLGDEGGVHDGIRTLLRVLAHRVAEQLQGERKGNGIKNFVFKIYTLHTFNAV